MSYYIKMILMPIFFKETFVRQNISLAMQREYRIDTENIVSTPILMTLPIFQNNQYNIAFYKQGPLSRHSAPFHIVKSSYRSPVFNFTRNVNTPKLTRERRFFKSF